MVAGIDTDPNRPGHKHILLSPHPGLSSASATYDSIRGPIVSAWKTEGGQFVWDVTIPANTTATARIPTSDAAAVREGGQKIDAASGVVSGPAEASAVVYELPSGTYHFTAPLPTGSVEK